MFMSKLSSQVISDLDAAIVSTPRGRIRGILKEGTYMFRGIKYADAKRFQMPQPVAPWEGVRDALAYGCICPNVTTPVPGDQFVSPHAFGPQDEHCQYLNVWTQSIEPGVRKPVVFWIHGGAGSSVEQYCYDGEEMSKFGDVVVVTSNHRMNILGCLDFSDYGEEYKNSLWLSLADLVAGLEWVRENIASFGGDPDNVTIEGQSFGGFKTVALLQSPAADGLYCKAISSGDAIKYPQPVGGYQPRELNRMLAAKMVQLAGGMETLETVTYEELCDIYLAADKLVKEETGSIGGIVQLIPSGPEGEYYVGHPIDVGFRKETLNIPLLMGTSFGEHHSNLQISYDDGCKYAWSDEKTRGIMEQVFREDAAEIEAEYRRLYPQRSLADSLFTDRESRYNCRRVLKKRLEAEGAAPMYFWQFDYDSPFMGGITAWHCSEIHFHFHNAAFNEASFIPGVSDRLEDIMCASWCSFMHSGDPNCEGLPEWKPITEEAMHTMVFAPRCHAICGDDDRLLDLLFKWRGVKKL